MVANPKVDIRWSGSLTPARAQLLTILSAVLVGLAAFQSVSGPGAAPGAPFSLPSLMLAIPFTMVLQVLGLRDVPGLIRLLSIGILPAIFTWNWIRHLRMGEDRIPRRTWIFLYGLVCAIPIWVVLGWDSEEVYSSVGTQACLSSQSGLGLVLSLVLAWRVSRRPTWIGNLLFHTWFLLFFFWCALPITGELP